MTNEELEALANNCSAMDERIKNLEKQMKSVPKIADFFHLGIAALVALIVLICGVHLLQQNEKNAHKEGGAKVNLYLMDAENAQKEENGH